MTSRSLASSNAVDPAVCEVGPVQMWRKMQDPRPFTGGVALELNLRFPDEDHLAPGRDKRIRDTVRVRRDDWESGLAADRPGLDARKLPLLRKRIAEGD